MADEPILKVAISVPLSREFDYLPVRAAAMPSPGSRVLVPFGRRRRIGIVTGQSKASDFPAAKLRRCLEVVDDEPLLSTADLQLIRFTSGYYHHPIGEVIAAALPALLRQGKALAATRTCIAVTAAGEAVDVGALTRRAPRQAELICLLRDAGGNGIDTDALTEEQPNWRRAARPLFQKGLITRFEISARPSAKALELSVQPGPELNPAQQQAVNAIRVQTGFAAFLLDGVTGSGKTEVYLRVMADVIATGRQVLILVPEIGLTPQLVSRLRNRLGIDPAVLHSGLTDVERLVAWRAARDGTAQLVVGTRSAVFTPMPELGLVIVDEEHDQSLKQQEGLRYSARDLAIVRAKHRDIAVILGSATPTLESLQHCRDGDYQRLLLPERAGAAQPPSIRLVDLSRVPCTDGLSEPLLAAIAAQLDTGGQVLMFLNRRGFAPTLICGSCGHIAECRRCDSRMTVHARDRSLRCHHCGASRALEEQCDECGAAVRPLGEGTERLEETLRLRFPNSRIKRIDSDTTQQKGAIAAALAEAEQGGADILVGTQMLSKGHHFPKLSLVGIVNADQGLFGTDFRASERLAQSIVQVAGRAGRENRRGEVVIQTAFPSHPFWRCLLEGGYRQLADAALAEREQSRWPPFSRLALIRSAAHRQADAHALLDIAKRHLLAQASDELRVLGPVDAPMARRAGRYRAQLLLQSSSRKPLHAALAAVRSALESDPAARKARWSIDVDPIELF
jgi:primosomal protein N' (replication factor Y)